MTSWRGVPDFGDAFELEGFGLFGAGDEANLFVYLPRRLVLAPVEGGAGVPDFSLEIIRGENPFRPPQPYGVIDFRLRAEPFSDAALEALRRQHPGAALLPPLFTCGWLRMGDLKEGPAEGGDEALEAPVALASNGLDATRYLRRLSLEEATRVKGFLQQEVLSYGALAEMRMDGVAETLPVALEFTPARLVTALRERGDADGVLPVSRLVEFWMQDPAELPVTAVAGADRVERTRLAQVLAEWSLAEYGELIPSPVLPVQPSCRIGAAQDLPELARWDLLRQRVVPRMVLLDLDPFEAARELAASAGLQAVLRETTVPPLETGVVSLTVGVNLPDELQGVVMLGVNLLAPATPPQRVQPLTASLAFEETRPYQTVRWRFSPVEEVSYRYTTFALVRGPGGITRLQGTPKPHRGPYLLLGVDDFPLGFVPVRASELLLSLAVIAGTVSYPDPGGADVELPFELEAARSAVTVVLPSQAMPRARIRLEARAVAGEEVLSMGEFPARGLRLDLNSLREYGPHTVPVEVAFDSESALVALEFLSQADADHPERSTTLSFTPERPDGSWHYLATSPFEAGYRYRRQSEPGLPPFPWSEPRLPFDALQLKASEVIVSH